MSQTEHNPVAIDYHQIYPADDGGPGALVCEVEGNRFDGDQNELDRFYNCPACGRRIVELGE